MIPQLVVFVMLLVSIPGFGQSGYSKFENIYDEIKQKNFFKARDLFNRDQKNLAIEYRYFTEAVLDNVFNKPKESNEKIIKLENSKTRLADSLMLKIWHIKGDNSMKQYDYAGAKNAVQIVLSQYHNLLTADEITDLKNNLTIWAALEAEPRQKISINGGARLKMEKDIAGLKNLKVKVEEDTMNFIFDTGADHTILYTPFYQENKKEIDKLYKVTKISMGGAGGKNRT